MRVLATPEALEYVRRHGGAVFVWVEPTDTQGRVRFVAASTDSPGPEREFTRMSGGGFDLFVDSGGLALPERLELELRGWRRKRLRASWNGATFPSDRKTPDPG